QLPSHVSVVGPAGCAGQSWLAVWHAPRPLQVAALAATSARRRQLSPLKPAYWPTHETAPHSLSGSVPSAIALQMPSLPGTSQRPPVPANALVQHTPPTQGIPLSHWPEVVQAPPALPKGMHAEASSPHAPVQASVPPRKPSDSQVAPPSSEPSQVSPA